MTEFSAGRPRRLDGPIRRPAQPLSPVASTAPLAPPGSSALQTVPASFAPARPAFPAAGGQTVKRRQRRRWRLWIGLVVLALVLAIVGFLVVTALLAANKIFTKGGSVAPALSGQIDPSMLKHEGDGRVNILLMGIGGYGHDGSNLSDTMMIMSIDPKTKDVALLSIPRDLYVKIPGYGYGKINAANADGGAALAEKVVETVTGVPIHYYVQADFTGFKQAVDAVGGVDINVKQALYDPAYPCETGYNYCPYSQPAGQFHMNGLQALRYARCRHDDPTTGANCGNDTGRAARQQEVLTALRKQALSAGTLANPIKLASLIDAIGSHVKTDLQLPQLKQLALIIKGVDPSKIVNKVLEYTGPNAVLTTANNAAGAVLIPRAGMFNYTDIQNLAHSLFVDHYITGENALVQVQNGSTVPGLAATVVTSLKASHYNVMDPVTAAQTTATTQIIDYTGGRKPYTINYLQQRFGVTAQTGTPGQQPAPLAQTSGSSASAAPATTPPEIVVILGSDYAQTAASATGSGAN